MLNIRTIDLDAREVAKPSSLSGFYKIFYYIKPVMPRSLQLLLRRQRILYKKAICSHIWPVDEFAGTKPQGWKGWPHKKRFALALMHDVDTQKGHDNVRTLMDVEEELGIRSTFNFVPERYQLSLDLIREVKRRGFEVGVHGLKHDGKLFSSRAVFLQRALLINGYLEAWGTSGFSAPSMVRNLQWMSELKMNYCTASFDTDPFEPQPEAARTIFPYWIYYPRENKKYLEIPYTLPQDFTLFVLMKESSTKIWDKKVAWIAGKGGLALVNTHPDYMNFDGKNMGPEEYDVSLYKKFILRCREEYGDSMWETTSKNIYDYFTQSVVPKANSDI